MALNQCLSILCKHCSHEVHEFASLACDHCLSHQLVCDDCSFPNVPVTDVAT